MECKGAYADKEKTILCGINRNIVECKVICKAFVIPRAFTVLIETLWNVKLYNSRKGIWSNVVLIETLWNVKQIASSVHP